MGGGEELAGYVKIVFGGYKMNHGLYGFGKRRSGVVGGLVKLVLILKPVDIPSSGG